MAFTVLPFIVASFQGGQLSLTLWSSNTAIGGQGYSANRFLSLLLLVLCLMLIEHVVDLSGYYYYVPALIDAISPLFLMVGPLLYGYVFVATSPKAVLFQRRHLLHLLPSLLQFIILLPLFLNTQYDAKYIFFYFESFEHLAADDIDVQTSCSWIAVRHWASCITEIPFILNQPDYNLRLTTPLALVMLSDLNEWALLISLCVYIALAQVRLKCHTRYLKQIASNTTSIDLRWMSVFIGLISTAGAVFVGLSMLEIFFDIELFETVHSTYVIYLLLALAVVYLGISAIRQTMIFTADLDLEACNVRLDELSLSAEGGLEHRAEIEIDEKQQNGVDCGTNKYKNSQLSKEAVREIAEHLKARMATNKDFLDSELSLKGLSERIAVSPHHLSQAINQSIGMNFYDAVNDYRLAEFKQQIDRNKGMTILQAAIESGFKSKTSFYQFFRKREGMTPSEWKKKRIDVLP